MSPPPGPETCHFPTSIRFGAERIAEFAAARRELGSARPLVVTDRGLQANPMIAARRGAGGMDAPSRALEAYCRATYHPMADGIALEAMRLVAVWLPRAVADGADLEARAHMPVAASMGAVAFQKGLGAMHAMSHPCSARFDTHHGLTNAVPMPYVLVYNRPAIEARVSCAARVLGLGKQNFDGFLDWVLALREEIAIPHDLSAIGVPADAAALLAPLAEADALTGLNPRPVDAKAYVGLYEAALSGALAREWSG